MTRRVIEHSARGLAAAVFAYGLTGGIACSLYLDMPATQTALVCGAAALLVFLWLYNRVTCLCGLVVLALGGLIARFTVSDGAWERLGLQCGWMLNYATNLTEYDFVLAEGAVYPVAVLSGVLSALLFRHRFGFLPALVLGLGGIIAENALGHAEVIPFLIPVLAALLCLYAYGAYGAKKNAAVHITALLLPLSLIVLPLVYVAMPGNTFPSNGFVRSADRVNDLFGDYVLFTRPRYAFSIGASGFMPLDGRLGGPIIQDEEEIMRVSTRTPQLMRAITRDHYDGRMWSDMLEQKRMMFNSPFTAGDRETVFGAGLVEDALTTPFVTSADYTVTLLKESYSTLYVPYRPVAFEGEDIVVYFNNSGELFGTRNLPEGSQYTFTSYVPLEGRAGFGGFVASLSENDDAGFTAAQSVYTHVSDTVDERVIDLAWELSDGAATPYEVAKAIQSYLMSDAFTYTTSPPAPPEDADFASYFLLEDRQGYCTYYATAMTVMARAVGIPARYCEGFMLKQQYVGAREMTVRGADAHAWTEVYLKGYGWLALDATPLGLNVPQPYIGGTGDIEQPIPTPEMPLDQEPFDYSPIVRAVQDNSLYVNIAAGALGAALLTLIVVLIARRYNRSRPRKQRGISRSQSAMCYYTDILYLLRCFGNHMMTGDTPYDFANRVDAWLRIPEGTLRRVTDIVVRMRYGGIEPTLGDMDALDGFHAALEKDARRYVGVFGYLRYRMFTIPKPREPYAPPVTQRSDAALPKLYAENGAKRDTVDAKVKIRADRVDERTGDDAH